MQLRSGKVTSAHVLNWPTIDSIKYTVSQIETANDAINIFVSIATKTTDNSLVFMRRRAVLMGVEIIRRFRLWIYDPGWFTIYKDLIEKLKPFPHLAEYIE